MEQHTAHEALQLAASPVILISACGLLLLSMTNRLGRAIDRAHHLIREPNANKQQQIQILTQRASWIRYAILGTSTTILLTSVLVLVLFLSVFVEFNVRAVIVPLFIVSMLSLCSSICFFIADISGSLRAMEVDLLSLSKTS